jgi:hypothetical protein
MTGLALGVFETMKTISLDGVRGGVMAIAKIAFARNLFTSLIVLAYQLVAVALSLVY